MLETCQPESPRESEGWPWAEPTDVTAGEATTAHVTAARALLDASRLVSGLLRLARPDVGERSERIARLVTFVIRRLDLSRSWEFEVAARLSQVGCLGLPPETFMAACRGEALDDDDLMAVASHPLAARDLLAGVPRLEGVAEMVARQTEPVALPGERPRKLADRDRLDVGGQMLRVCGEFDRLVTAGTAVADAIAALQAQPAEFDPEIVSVLEAWNGRPPIPSSS